MMNQKYEFPIKKPSTDGSAANTNYTYDEIMDALDDSGHYLLGKNNRWHGGVHYKQTFSQDKSERIPVYAIGNGTIVAYRLKTETSTLTSVEPIKCTNYDYSTSFVLIKHELRVVIEPPEGAEENAATILGNQLNDQWSTQTVILAGNGQHIYHSADLNTFNRDPLDRYVTITITGVDPQIANFGDHESYIIRGRRSDGTDVWLEGFGADGNILEAGGTASLTPTNPDAVNTTPAEDTTDEGTKLLTFYSLYMHLADYEEYINKDNNFQIINDTSIRSYHSGTIGDTALRVAKKGEVFKRLGGAFKDGTTTYHQIAIDEVLIVKDGETKYAEDIDILPRLSYWPENGTPPTLNTVHSCEIPIKKGDLIGHLGIYEIPTEVTGGMNKKHQVHIEIFTEDNEEFERFYRNDRDLFQDQKYIRLRDGYTISTQMNETASTTNILYTVSGEHILKLDISDTMANNDNVPYYRLINIPSNIFRGNSADKGYIRQDSLRGTGVFCQHDWDQLGFKIVKEENDNADGFIDVPETPQFFQDIYQELLDTTLPDEPDTPAPERGTSAFNLAALKFRLNDKLFREKWSKIIAKHPTEWEVDGDDDRWKHLKDIFSVFKKKSDIEKQERLRITKSVFWDDLSDKPGQTNILHFHPMAFINNLKSYPETRCLVCNKKLTLKQEFIRSIAPDINLDIADTMIYLSKTLFDKYKINTCSQIIHLFGQAMQETQIFTKFREDLYYRRKPNKAGAIRAYRISTTKINAGFGRLNARLAPNDRIITRDDKIDYIDENLLNNDAAYGEHLYGRNEYPNVDFRGRGFIHITDIDHYEPLHNDTGLDVLNNPSLLENDYSAIFESGLWYWNWKTPSRSYTNNGHTSLRTIANNQTLSLDNAIRIIARIINGSNPAQHEDNRIIYTNRVKRDFVQYYGACNGFQE